MKLGVFTVLLGGKPMPEAFQYLASLGVQTVEIGTGGYPGTAHLDPRAALENPAILDELRDVLAKNKLEISALSCHGNPVHPNKERAAKDHEDFVATCKIAQKLGVDTVVTFSGCPGDHDGAKNPNWVTCSWPPEYAETLAYQWDEVLIPYWKDAANIAKQYGVTKIALELHPGFAVYNPAGLLRLRAAVGDCIGANFDPSHLLWQGIKPAEAIKALRGAIFHFHAKDTFIDTANVAVNGVLDTGHYADFLGRSWTFRTVGYGTGESAWRETISALQATGYTGAISIEHEDGMMSLTEGLEKAVSFLKPLIIQDPPMEMWWA